MDGRNSFPHFLNYHTKWIRSRNVSLLAPYINCASRYHIRMCPPSASILSLITCDSGEHLLVFLFKPKFWLWNCELKGLNEQRYCLLPVNILIDTGLFLLSKAVVTLASNHTFMHLPDYQIILWFCKVRPDVYPEYLMSVFPQLLLLSQ